MKIEINVEKHGIIYRANGALWVVIGEDEPLRVTKDSLQKLHKLLSKEQVKEEIPNTPAPKLKRTSIKG